MPAVKLRASTILGAFEEAQTELVGKAVVLTDGKAGTVENVWLRRVARSANLDQGPRWKVADLNHQTRAALRLNTVGIVPLRASLKTPVISAACPSAKSGLGFERNQHRQVALSLRNGCGRIRRKARLFPNPFHFGTNAGTPD
jgi:hypothetical protein